MFEKTIELLERGQTPQIGLGAWFDFRSGPMALWEGMTMLDASPLGGPVFSPSGAFGKVGPMELGAIKPTRSLNFYLSGLDPKLLALARAQDVEVKRRLVRVFYLCFDRTSRLVEVENIATYFMDKIPIKVDPNIKPPTFSLILTAEPMLSEKHRAPLRFLSYIDQKRAFPADEGLYLVQRVAAPSMPFVWN